MHSDRIPESTKQWLQNEDFILWCLAPTQESEEWWVNYQKEHPEDQASLQEARKIILSARLNPVQRLPEESERLWARIETSMERRDKRHRLDHAGPMHWMNDQIPNAEHGKLLPISAGR